MADETTPAYAIVQITINDPADFNERYAQYVFPILDKFGAQMIAGSPTPQTKEGDFAGNWAAVIRFPSMQIAEDWYNSAEYLPYKELRINELTNRTSLVFLGGFDPGSPS